eukprot:scaffold677005_cov38-Prasinocladus_malaysianus.AAC.1
MSDDLRCSVDSDSAPPRHPSASAQEPPTETPQQPDTEESPVSVSGRETGEPKETGPADVSTPDQGRRRLRFWGGAPMDWERAVGIRPSDGDNAGEDGHGDQPWWADLD